MWRFVVLGVLVVIVYFMVRSALRGLFGKGRDVALSERKADSPSEMVQDPICGMYVAREGAYFLQQGGETQFFCSETCRASFQKKLSSA